MGEWTDDTRRWLDKHFDLVSEEGIYYALQPIYGIESAHSHPHPLFKAALTYQILRALDALRFESFLDVGGGEGYLADLIKSLLGAEGFSADLSPKACRRALELFGVDAVAIDASRLPFPDSAFDLVICSEVIEHVEHPIEVLLEIDRVARSVLLVTTEQAYAEPHVRDRMIAARSGLPHAERGFFAIQDFRNLLGPGADIQSQLFILPEIESPTFEAAADWVRRATAREGVYPGGLGVLAVKRKDARVRPASRRHSDEELLRAVLSPRAPEAPLSSVARERPAGALVAALRCPACRSRLEETVRGLSCERCAREVPIEAGVPVFRVEPGDEPSRETTRLRLERSIGADPRDIAAIMDLRDRLAIPTPPARRDWDFGKAEDRAFWHPNEQLSSRAGDGSAYHWASTGTDPWLVSPRLGIPIVGVGAVEVTMRVYNPAFGPRPGAAQLFWASDEEMDFDEAHCALFHPLNDGMSHVYRVPVSDHRGWPSSGRLLWLRLDPGNGPGEIDLHRIRLTP